MIKLAIFDLDGTLLDTVGDLMHKMNLMLVKYGLETVNREQVIRHIGRGAEEFVIGCLPEKERKNAGKYFEEYLNVLNNTPPLYTKPFDGITELLKELKQRGIRIAVLTNKPQKAAEIAVKQYLFENGIDMVCGQTETSVIKPDKTELIKILSHFGIEKEQAVMIGDGEPDVQVALNAGIKQIAVLWGYRTKEQLEQAGAVCFASDTNDVLKQII